MSAITLHSILVKSIRNVLRIFNEFSSLYIPFWLNLYGAQVVLPPNWWRLYIPFWLNLYRLSLSVLWTADMLYIPFWLNLYWNKLYRCVESCGLYIPFWLNLYWLLILRYYHNFQALHSILVKSIHGRSFIYVAGVSLYIPFWLNLYSSVNKGVECMSVFTFHSG